MNGYIYSILNVENNKRYIGLTTRDPRKRKKEHFDSLYKNKHCNRKLQYAYNKYSEQSFVFEVLETINNCSEDALSEREIYYITLMDAIDNGYNIQSGGLVISQSTKDSLIDSCKSRSGENHYRFGQKVSDDIRKKISETKKLQSISPSNQKLTKEDVFYILCIDENIKRKKKPLARFFNVSQKTVQNLTKREIYKKYCEEYENLTLEQKSDILKEALGKCEI